MLLSGTSTYEQDPMGVGALLTIGTAVRNIPLVDQTSPLDNFWQVRWDHLQQDRFWAWVDAGLAERIAKLAELHTVAEEPDAAHWHPAGPGFAGPATRSWKETRFDVSNVQLTFHEGDRQDLPKPDGTIVHCVLVEPDIDYYKDTVAHGLLEVLPNLASGGKTDPRVVSNCGGWPRDKRDWRSSRRRAPSYNAVQLPVRHPSAIPAF